jgi:hypothetical protein
MKQLELEMFFPLTEQIPLDLDYGPTHLHFRAKGIAGVNSMPILGTIHEFITVPSAPITTFTSSRLTIDVQSTIIKLKTKPPLYRRALYRLLGLKWETK